MQITLSNVGKRYNREWIFRNISYTFSAPNKYAITGANGSGKSTLLQVIAGSLTHNEGAIVLQEKKEVAANSKQAPELYQHISIAAPYLELIEEMTAGEMLDFHNSFKPITIPKDEALQIVGLGNASHKQIRYFSSGMKQRLKLALAFFSQTPVLLLDEPTTNLDAEGIALYQMLIQKYTADKLVIISSNDKQEFAFCAEVINIGLYK